MEYGNAIIVPPFASYKRGDSFLVMSPPFFNSSRGEAVIWNPAKASILLDSRLQGNDLMVIKGYSIAGLVATRVQRSRHWFLPKRECVFDYIKVPKVN
jgi:hypothetical protein